jgi:hypothetical protein
MSVLDRAAEGTSVRGAGEVRASGRKKTAGPEERVGWSRGTGLELRGLQFGCLAICAVLASSSFIHSASTSSGTGARVAVRTFSAPSRRMV